MVLINLLTNAYKFTEQGEIVVTAVEIPDKKKSDVVVGEYTLYITCSYFVPSPLYFTSIPPIGPSLSYVHVISLLAVTFVFHARSLNFPTSILTFAVPFHVVFAFTVHTATVFDTTLKLWIVAFVTLKSLCSTHCTASLNVHVTVKTLPLVHASPNHPCRIEG